MSNSLHYRERSAEVAEQMRKLRQSQPDLLSAFGALGAAGSFRRDVRPCSTLECDLNRDVKEP